MSLLEALAQGLPALVSPEVDRLVPVLSRDAGWVAPPADLGQRLEALANVPAADWSRRISAARQLARGYDWDVVAAAYEEVYSAAVRGRAAGGGALPDAVAP